MKSARPLSKNHEPHRLEVSEKIWLELLELAFQASTDGV